MLKLKQMLSNFLELHYPIVNIKLKYLHHYKSFPNLKSPKTFSEKLLWLSLHTYNENDQIRNLSDKYEVRQYIEECGFGNLLNELYFVTDKPEKINYADLPQQFVFKRSTGCGTNLICPNKNDLMERKFFKTISWWKKSSHVFDVKFARYGGIDVKDLPMHYVCEKYLTGRNSGIPEDYKIYCFNGVPKCVLYITDRFEKGKSVACFMDTEWNLISAANKQYVMAELPEKPESLSTMLEAAETLSKPFPFVRVDFYECEGKAVFGEMTFFPHGCIGVSETVIDGKTMGELLDLSGYITD